MNNKNQDDHGEFAEEYKTLNQDLKKTLIHNGILLVLLIALYMVNKSTGFLNGLENLF